MTDVAALALAAVDGASGYAERTGWRLADVDPAAAAVEANEKAELTRGAVELEPGSYPAVLEAPAFAELLAYFSYDAFGALGLIEERSYAFDKLGQKVFDERFSLADDALDARGLPKALRLRGHAQAARRARRGRRAAPASSGTARAPSAPAAGRRRPATRRRARCATGARCRSRSRSRAARPSSPEQLAELVGDGIYVTRLHYLSIVDPREGIVTGMTRDGTFRIRGGKIADPLVNLRFTVSVPQLLAELPGPDPRARADQPERLLRRALPDRAALAGGRDRALRRHRRRLWPRSLTRAVVDRAELVLAPAAQARRDEAGVGDPGDRDQGFAGPYSVSAESFGYAAARRTSSASSPPT